MDVEITTRFVTLDIIAKTGYHGGVAARSE